MSVGSPAISDRNDLARSFDESLAGILSLEQLLAASAADRDLSAATQRELVGLGWQGVATPCEQGGLGLDRPACAQLAAVAGRRLLPIAMRAEAFLLAPCLAAVGREGDARGADRLEALLAGDLRGGGGSATGPAGPVLAWLAPDASLVALAGDGWATVLDLERDEASVERFSALDRGQGGVRVETPVATDHDPRVPVQEILDGWRLASICEAFGAGQRALELAIAYAGEREQFGKPIATFQAVSHALARAAVDMDGAQAAIGRYVAIEDDAAQAADLLSVVAHWVPAAARVACECSIQVHGGMGFTWELGLHLYYRRVLQVQYQLGGASTTARAAADRYLARVERSRSG